MDWRVITAPAQLPLRPDDIRGWSRISTSADTAEIDAMIRAATERVEELTGRRLITQTLEVTLDDWPESGTFELDAAPLQSVTSIKYLDTGGVLQTLSAAEYQVDIKSDRPRLSPEPGYTWPALESSRLNRITIQAVFGYGTEPTSVPDTIRQAMKQIIGYWYDHGRESNRPQQMFPMPESGKILLEPYRLDRMAEIAD